MLGCSENAVKTHLWIAIIAYLLLARVKALYKSPHSITEIGTLVKVYGLVKMDLRQLVPEPQPLILNQDVVNQLYFDNNNASVVFDKINALVVFMVNYFIYYRHYIPLGKKQRFSLYSDLMIGASNEVNMNKATFGDHPTGWWLMAAWQPGISLRLWDKSNIFLGASLGTINGLHAGLAF